MLMYLSTCTACTVCTCAKHRLQISEKVGAFQFSLIAAKRRGARTEELQQLGLT